MSYTKNDFGINLLTEQRPYVYFSADNLIGLALFQLRPSVLARGADASVKGFPEENVCLSLKIEVIQAGTKKRASSTQLRTTLEPDVLP